MVETLTVTQQSIAIFVFQIGFLYFRTLNVRFVVEKNVLAAVFTGFGIGICWLIASALGVKAVLTGEVFPVIAHLIGGAIGTIIGMYKRKGKVS